MHFTANIKKLLLNKVALYVASRYFTYLIQFITSIYIAVELGPFYFGVYGFIMLIISYLGLINMGVPHSMNVLLVQNKNNENSIKDIESNSVFLISVISILISIFCVTYYVLDLNLFEKYAINNYLLFIGVLSVIGHFNTLFLVVYRFRISLFEIAFQLSFTPILVLVSLFLAKGQNLLYVVLFANIAGNLVSLFIFIVRKKIQLGGKISKYVCISILTKGLFLFIYLTTFYLIIISTRSVISAKYSVESFGYFTFSFTLANSILLFLQAFSFIISAKVLDKLNSNDKNVVFSNIQRINVNYVTITYAILFMALFAFPFLLNLFPQYRVVLPTLNMISLSIMLYSNSFAHSSFLIANNKEKILAVISLLALLVNIFFALFLTLILKVEIEYVVLSTMLSYLIFGILCSYYTHKSFQRLIDFKVVLNDFFPLRLFIPYVTAILVVILGNQFLMSFPIILLFILNYREIGVIIKSVKLVVKRSNIVDIQ